MTIRFFVPGPPTAKGRPRMTRAGVAYTPAKTVAYENLVCLEFERQTDGKKFGPEDELTVEIVAYYQIPKTASKRKMERMVGGELRPLKKPDVDNVAKSILDSLNGIAYHDDSQVISCKIEKYYAYTPCVIVEITGREKEV